MTQKSYTEEAQAAYDALAKLYDIRNPDDFWTTSAMSKSQGEVDRILRSWNTKLNRSLETARLALADQGLSKEDEITKLEKAQEKILCQIGEAGREQGLLGGGFDRLWARRIVTGQSRGDRIADVRLGIERESRLYHLSCDRDIQDELIDEWHRIQNGDRKPGQWREAVCLVMLPYMYGEWREDFHEGTEFANTDKTAVNRSIFEDYVCLERHFRERREGQTGFKSLPPDTQNDFKMRDEMRTFSTLARVHSEIGHISSAFKDAEHGRTLQETFEQFTKTDKLSHAYQRMNALEPTQKDLDDVVADLLAKKSPDSGKHWKLANGSTVPCTTDASTAKAAQPQGIETGRQTPTERSDVNKADVDPAQASRRKDRGMNEMDERDDTQGGGSDLPGEDEDPDHEEDEEDE